MRKFVCSVFFICVAVCCSANASFTSCGPGFVLASHNKIDGIKAQECVKLWCYDLENGDVMGRNDTANSGYQITSEPVELCDKKNNCISCWGDRKWCKGETVGIWNPEYGAYTKNGADETDYVSYKNGDCFAWEVGKPVCENGNPAILRDGKWICVKKIGAQNVVRESGVRRTSGTNRNVSGVGRTGSLRVK